jgi:predicted transcriptional regulator
MNALSQEKRRGRVPQIVKADGRHIRRSEHAAKFPGGVPWIDRCPDRRRSERPNEVSVRSQSAERPSAFERCSRILEVPTISRLAPRTNAARGSIPDTDTHIDKLRNRSYAGLMNLQVPPELEAKLTRLAAETGRTADQVALELLASSVDHDEWFRAEVEKGRAAAREGRLLEHDDVAARMDRRYRG